MKIEVWSDIACPFCYIGKKNFELALDQFPHKDEIDIEYKSFELDPYAPKEQNQNVHEMLASKYGVTMERAKEMNQSVVDRGAETGIKFNMDKVIPTNTFDANRLLHLAKEFGKQPQMADRLFEAYFVEGKNISDMPTLRKLAQDVGIESPDFDLMLSSDKYTLGVRKDEQAAEELGLSGVPAFVVADKYLISGAQSPKAFLEALKEAWGIEFERGGVGSSDEIRSDM
jgi:predicted DsbA family dithiol-disulfide isomerase